MSRFLALAVVGYHSDRPGAAPADGPAPPGLNDDDLDARYGDDDDDEDAAPAAPYWRSAHAPTTTAPPAATATSPKS